MESASVIEDRETGRSRGFAFVEMATPEEAAAAIEQFNGKDFGGRNLTVNEAKPRADRGGRGGNYAAATVEVTVAAAAVAAVAVGIATNASRGGKHRSSKKRKRVREGKAATQGCCLPHYFPLSLLSLISSLLV